MKDFRKSYTPMPRDGTLENLETCSNTVKCLALGCRATSICNIAVEKPVTLLRCDSCRNRKIAVRNQRGDWVELSPDDMEWDMEDPDHTDCQEVKDILADLDKCSEIEKIELSHYDLKDGEDSGFLCESCDAFHNAPAGWDKDD